MLSENLSGGFWTVLDKTLWTTVYCLPTGKCFYFNLFSFNNYFQLPFLQVHDGLLESDVI